MAARRVSRVSARCWEQPWLASTRHVKTHDYVAMCEAWFNAKNGLDLVLNLHAPGDRGLVLVRDLAEYRVGHAG